MLGWVGRNGACIAPSYSGTQSVANPEFNPTALLPIYCMTAFESQPVGHKRRSLVGKRPTTLEIADIQEGGAASLPESRVS